MAHLTTETVQCATLAFQSVDNIHSRDGLPFGVLSVSDGVSDDVLEEDFENASCLFIDEARDTLYTASASKTSNGRLGDALDVITKDFAMAFGTTFAQAFSAFI